MYFSSLGSAEELEKLNMGFIGVVKTATTRFPVAYLLQLEMQDRGEHHGLVLRDNDGISTMMDFVWLYRNRQNFIENSSSLQEGLPYIWNCWRQVDQTPNFDAKRVELSAPQPKAAEVYYIACAKFDVCNRHRQDTLNLENNVEVKTWDKRVNMSLFSIMVVDTWLAFTGCTRAEEVHK